MGLSSRLTDPTEGPTSLEEAKSDLCESCRRMTLEDLKAGFSLGTYQDATERAESCRLCALVLSEPKRWSEYDLSSSHTIVLQDIQGDLSSLAVSIVASNRQDYPVKQLRVWVAEDSPAAKAQISPGRPFLPAKSDAAFKLIRGWLSNCRRSHKSCQRKFSDFHLGPEGAGGFPARLLDVGSLQNPSLNLIHTSGNTYPYAALSYCWGPIQELKPLRTTKSNLQSFAQAIPEDELPKTIRDATEVARQLGLRHLWVDSLCIVQDDNSDWRDQSSIMGSIFGNAVCTIAATAAVNSGQGLWYRGMAPDEAALLHHLGNAVEISCTSGRQTYRDIFISPVLPSADFKNDIERSLWSQRAWVIQERILSRRIIHFARNQLYWECHEALSQEISSTSLPHEQLLLTKPAMFQKMRRETTMASRLTVTNHSLRTVVSNVTAFKDKVRYVAGGGQELQDSEPILNRFWARIVLQYNCADITFNSDKLVAIQGLARSVARVSGQTYFAGLWLEDISRGLFWHASLESGLSRQKDTNAPSWSWAGWHGAVKLGSFMAEIDTGRPRPSDRAYETSLNGSSNELELHAHYWPAKPRLSVAIQIIDEEREMPWKSTGMMIFPPFDTLIGECLRGRPCLQIDIFHGNNQGELNGYVCFDDSAYRNGDLQIPPALFCIVMYTETVEHIELGERAFAYYLLAVKPSAQEGKYERLGIGVAVSTVDVIPSGLLGGRNAPTGKIVLV